MTRGRPCCDHCNNLEGDPDGHDYGDESAHSGPCAECEREAALTIATDIDLTWRPVAEASRQALALLGHPIDSACLPHEAEPCGAGYGMHVAAHFATIKALVDHQLMHLGMREVVGEVYEHKRRELAHSEVS